MTDVIGPEAAQVLVDRTVEAISVLEHAGEGSRSQVGVVVRGFMPLPDSLRETIMSEHEHSELPRHAAIS